MTGFSLIAVKQPNAETIQHLCAPLEIISNESPPAYAGGIIIGQAPLVQNLRALDTLYSVVSLPR